MSLELDCFNEDLKLAFEYQGTQHYKPVRRWGGKKAFEKQQYRDEIKRQKCKELGIRLIEVDGRVLRNIRSIKRKKEILQEMVDSIVV